MELRGFWCGTEGVELGVCRTKGFSVLNRGVFGGELRGFGCGTEGFSGLKRSGPLVWN